MTLTDQKKIMFIRPERESAGRIVMIHEMCFKNWKKRKYRVQAAKPLNPVFFWGMESVVKHLDLENLGRAV